MLSSPFKSIQHWHRAISPQLIDLTPHLSPAERDGGLCMLILAAAVLPLCVVRGLVEPDALTDFWDTDPYAAMRSLLEDLNQHCHLGFPLEQIPEQLPLAADWLHHLHLAILKEPLPLDGLGTLYETTLGVRLSVAQSRKVRGSYYTPAELVNTMVAPVLQQLPEPEVTILDPACGGGAFLLAAYQGLLQREPNGDWQGRSHRLQHSIYGIDQDPLAAAVTRLTLLLKLLDGGWDGRSPLPDLQQTIRCGNSLVDRDGSATAEALGGQNWSELLPPIVQRGGFDAVLGNPPYLDAEGMTRHQPELRRYCTHHYRTASGNWDLFCVFVERGLSFCRPGGWHSFVVPNKLLSAPYAGAVRSLLASENRLVQVQDYSRVAIFPAAVYPITYRVQHLPPDEGTLLCYEQMAGLNDVERQTWLPIREFRQEIRPWQTPATVFQNRAIARLQDVTPLSQWATVTDSATVAEAYAIQSLLQEASDELWGMPVVNSGTLDRYRILWGQKPLRYLGNTYRCPVIPAPQLHQLPPRRLYQARQTKILVAGMTRRLEAVLDETGGMLAGKSTTVILPRMNPYWLLGFLNSHLIQVWFSHTFGGNRLQGGYLRVGPAQVRQIPIRLPIGKLGDRLTSLVRQRMALEYPSKPLDNLKPQRVLDDEIDALVYQIYGLTAEDILAVMASEG